MGPLGFLGGTGPQGFGLALRFASAGEPVLIGSRAAERARGAAARLRAAVPQAEVDGVENAAVLAQAERVVLALPFAALGPFLAGCGARLAGKLVIDVIVPLAVHDGFAALVPIPGAASAGELIQQTVPAARVVSAFKNLPAAHLGDLSLPLAGDVLLCGDDADARAAVAALVGRLPGLRPVDAGALVNARYLEAITALLVNLNHRHHALTSIGILGLR